MQAEEEERVSEIGEEIGEDLGEEIASRFVGTGVTDILSTVAQEVVRRGIPALASMSFGPAAGVAVGALLVIAFKLYKSRNAIKDYDKLILADERDVISVNEKLEKLYERREKLRQALEKAPPYRKRLIEQSIKSVEASIRNLEELYALLQIRLEARKKILMLGGKKLAKAIEDIAKHIEKGEVPSKEVYKILEKASSNLEKTRVKEAVLLKIIENL